MSHAAGVLEFAAILSRLAAHCETDLAMKEAERIVPHWDADTVWNELDRTRQAYELISNDAPPSLAAGKPLRDALNRAGKGGVLGGLELVQIGEALSAMRSTRQFLNPKRETFPALWLHADPMPELPQIEHKLLDSLESGGDVRESASPALATLRNRRRGAQSRLVEKVQSYTSGKTRDLLSDPIYTVRDGRYVIPVKSEYRARVKGIVHDTSASGQTVFIEPEDVLAIANQIREIEAAERDEIMRILAKLSSQVGEHAREIQDGLEQIVYLDLLYAKARLAFEMKGSLPVSGGAAPGLSLEGARHPLLEQDRVVALDIRVGFEHKGLLITGPNTGGKTVAIKCVGLCVLMAQSGLYLPARMARLSPFSQVWADIGDEQSLQQSLSTFSGHIKNIAAAIKGLRRGALVLFDEIGAGTDPAEGAALAKAILLHLVDNGAVVLASTHYGELKAFAYETEGFQNAAMEFDAKTLRPTYRLIMGAPGASHALKIAERYGIPAPIVEQATGSLSEAHQDVGRMFEKLESAQKQARVAQGEADRRLNELREKEKVANRKLDEADEIRRTVHAKANAEIEAVLREVRLQAQDVFDELKKHVDEKALQAAREKLKEIQRKGEDRAKPFQTTEIRKTEGAKIEKGSAVRVDGYSQDAVVMDDPKDGKALVQVGVLKMTVPLAKLTLVPPKPVATKTSSMRLARAQSATMEIHLRAMRAEDAEEQLVKFLDEAVLAGLHQVRIVHGKGEGVLRKLTHDLLRRYRDVKSFRDGEPGEGGHGVTIAIFA